MRQNERFCYLPKVLPCGRAAYQYSAYKSDVHSALKGYLGEKSVTRGKKAFDIHENTYRVDADAIACFEYRRYRANGSALDARTSTRIHSSGVGVSWIQLTHEEHQRRSVVVGPTHQLCRALGCHSVRDAYGTVDQLGSPEEASGRRDCLRHSGIRVYEVVLAYVGFPRMVSTIHGLAGNVAGRAQEHLERPEYRSESRAYSDNTRHTADLFLDQLHGIHRGVRELQHGRADHA